VLAYAYKLNVITMKITRQSKHMLPNQKSMGCGFHLTQL